MTFRARGLWDSQASDSSAQRAALLAEATQALLADPLGFDSRLDKAARIAVPLIADCCIVDVTGVDRPLRRAVIAGTAPAGLPNTHAERVIASGRAETGVGLGHGFDAYMVVPLQARGRRLGAMTFLRMEGRPRYTDDDLEFAEDLATRAAFGADNARLYEQAKQANRARQEVMAVVSHDLKNPLQAIMGATHLMKMMAGQATPEKMAKQIAIVERAALRMNGLIRDLLDEVRLDEGQFALDRKQHEARGLVRDTVELFAVVAGEKQIRLEFQAESAPLYVWCDRERILQVLSNLVGNAIKFTPAGGIITLRLEACGAMALFRVQDTGPGIAEAELKKVFARYWRGRAQGRRAPAGTGLGLFIAKSIVDNHAGEIWAQSKLGQGSSFFFTLPVSEQSALEAAERPKRSTGRPRRQT